MTTRHLVADAYLALLSDVNADEFVYARTHFVLVGAGKYFYVYYDAALAVRNAEGRVADFAGFFAEDRAKKSLFGRKFGFAFRGNFTYENVAALHFRADTYDTVFVEVFERVVADVRDIARDFLLAEFRVARFEFVFFDVNRCENVVFYYLFGNKDCVLVVITFPAHKADKDISSEREFGVVAGRTVRDYFARFDVLSFAYDGFLIDAGALVGADKLFKYVFGYGFTASACERVDIFDDFDSVTCGLVRLVLFDTDTLGVYVRNGTAFSRQNHNAGVVSDFMLDAGADDGRFGFKKRNRLTLHVGSHESAVGIVVFEEGNKRGCDRYHLTRAYVHKVDVVAAMLGYVVAVTHHNALVYEPIVLVERLVSHCDYVSVLFVGGHIDDLVGDAVVYLVHSAVRSLDESVFIDARIRGKRVDKSDVLTFGRLDGAHSRIMRIVNVANLEGRALAIKSARSECGKFSLVGKFRNGVGFVHKLRQLARSEEFFDRACYGTYIYKVLRGCLFRIGLNLHSLADYSFESRDTDTELILQKFAYAADSAVTEVVDVVAVAYAVAESLDVVDRCDNVVDEKVLDDKKVAVLDDKRFEFLVIARRFVKNAFKGRIVNLFVDFERVEFFSGKRNEVADIHVAVTHYVESLLVAVYLYAHGVDAGVLDSPCGFFGNALACGYEKFAVFVDDVLGGAFSGDTGG